MKISNFLRIQNWQLIIILSFICSFNLAAQWSFNTMGNNYTHPTFSNLKANTNGNISVTYSGQRLNNSLVPEGIVLKGNFLYNQQVYDDAIALGIENALNTIPKEKWFKAKVGVSQTIQLNYQYNKYNNIASQPQQENSFTATNGILLGSKDAGFQFQNTGSIPTKSNETTNGSNVVSGTFTSTITFAQGSTRGYVIIPIQESVTNFSQQCDRALPPRCWWNTANFDNVIILPFVVEGPIIDISENNAVPILGRFREPAIPQMILHNPPGDGSFASFQTLQEACRSMSQSLTTEESNAGKLNITLGIAGSAGLFITTNFEFSVTASASVGAGNTQMKSNGQQNCVSILNSISTVPGAARANEGSIYLGYSSEIAYGMYPSVFINTSPTLNFEKDTSVIFGVVPNSASPFYFSKTNILNDIAQRQAIVNNPATTAKNRHEAQNQISIWRQVLVKDSINVNNPNAEVIAPTFEMPELAVLSQTATQTISTSETFDVTHFLEFGAGISFVIKVGGSGVDGGYEFKTKKTMGASVSNSNSSTTIINYSLFDNDPGDKLFVKIVRDKTYGTPIFLLDSALSRTSAPYEGGYPRDQPSLRFSASPANSSYIVPNVPVGTQSIFGLNICNNSNEQRTYNLRIDPNSNGNSAIIGLSGTSGNTEFGPFIVDANSCRPNIAFAFVTQANAAALSSADLNFQLYAANDLNRISNIYATCNWGDYAFPTGISTGQTNFCQGSSTSLPLTANCNSGSIATWYNNPNSSIPIGTGSPFLQSPTGNTSYYVSCNSGIYNYKKFPANSVTVNPSPVAPIITESGPLSFCAPSSVSFNTYSANDNKVLSFIKANSQYVEVPHNNSLNLSTSFTFEAWVNYSGVNVTIIDKGNYDFLWELNANGNGNKLGYYERNTGWKYSNDAVPENTWTHVALTLQNGTLTFYINGVASGTAAVASAFQDNQPMNIGRQQPTYCVCNHFNGSMDELRLWNVAKSQAEIQASMKTGVPPNSAGLVAYYKFNEASGNNVIDATSNNNNGVFVNGPTRQLTITVPFNELNVLWAPLNTTAPSITATTSGVYTATVSNGFGCSASVSKTVSANSNAALVSLSSPNDDFSSGTIIRTASSTSGKLLAANKITGISRVSYQAKAIELNAGFKADPGTVFSAEIGGCN